MHRKYKLRNFGFVEIDGKIFFSNLFFNGLVELDINTGRIDTIFQFPSYGRKTCWLYSKVIQAGKQLVFVPDWSEEIAIFDLYTHKFQTIRMDINLVGEKKPYFRCTYFYKDYIYMFPSKAKCILRYDLNKKKIKYIGKNIFEHNNDENYFRQQYEIISGKLYIPFTNRGNILIFDLETEKIEIVKLEDGSGWSTINYVNETMWMASWKNNEILQWNLRTQEINFFDDFPREFKTGEYKFAFSCVLGNKIFYFPVDGNMTIAFDILSKKIECAIKKEINGDEPITTYNVVDSNNRLFVISAGKEEIREYYLEQENLKECSYIKYDYEFNNKVIDEYFLLGSSGVEVESNSEDLNDFIKIVLNSEDKIENWIPKCKSLAEKRVYSILWE